MAEACSSRTRRQVMVERRLTWLASIVLLWGAVIFYKLISLQVLHHQEYVRHGAGPAGA